MLASSYITISAPSAKFHVAAVYVQAESLLDFTQSEHVAASARKPPCLKWRKGSRQSFPAFMTITKTTLPGLCVNRLLTITKTKGAHNEHQPIGTKTRGRFITSVKIGSPMHLRGNRQSLDTSPVSAVTYGKKLITIKTVHSTYTIAHTS